MALSEDDRQDRKFAVDTVRRMAEQNGQATDAKGIVAEAKIITEFITGA